MKNNPINSNRVINHIWKFCHTFALFEKFFTPLDIEQWEKDEELLFYTDPDDIEAVTSISYIQAQNRLKNPRSYYSEKK